MQLIEIILIVLTSIAIIILAALFLSYFGYKTRKKLEKKSKQQSEINPDYNDGTSDLNLFDSSISSSNQSKPQEKFVVFNPGLTKISKDNSREIKKHNPHKLFIKK